MRELAAVQPEEGLAGFEVVAYVKLVVWLSSGFVGVGLVVPVLFLVLADHDPDGLRGVDVVLVEADHH